VLHLGFELLAPCLDKENAAWATVMRGTRPAAWLTLAKSRPSIITDCP